ncbi:hypothetical protein U9M48_022836, partial [Paspalum notatum var. saurae]
NNEGLMFSKQAMKLYMFMPLLALLLLFCSNICCSTVSSNSADALALLEFKQAITNTNHPAEALSNWNSSTNICQWKGVTCNPKNRGRVTALDLAGQGLSGPIAGSVGNLTFLHTLNLSTNRFSGQIPPLNNLQKLQVLDLSTNSLQGSIPDTITNCSSLRTLWLFDNSFGGTIPSNIGHLSNILDFELAGNRLTGIIPPSIQNITGLTILYLAGNQLSGAIPDRLDGLRNLWYLSLANNTLEGVIPDALTNCSNLNILYLSGNKLKGTIPPRIGHLIKLEQLFFNGNGLSGIIPPGLVNITDLWSIDLSENQLNGTIPDEFWQMAKIQGLDLSSNNLSGGIPHALFNLSSLNTLSLAYNLLSKTLPSNVGDHLPNLVTLYLGANMFEGPIPASLGNASSLEQLDLSSNNLSGQIPSIFGKLSGLSYLNLERNMFEAIDSAGWEFFQGLTNCRSLEVLSLDSNHLQGFIPNFIGNLSTSLTRLLMGGNNLSGIVPSSIGNLTSLIELSLDVNNLTGTIEEWIGNLTELQNLNLQENSFTGTIPLSISNLAQLIFLSFGENKFTGLIPPTLGNLHQMNNLNLSYNSFQGSIPVMFGDLKQLISLDVSSNKLSGEIPETLGQCQQLVTIKMDQNILTGNIPSAFSNLSGLSVLNLSHNDLSGPLPACLNSLELLTELDLSYNNFGGKIPRGGVFGNATVVSLDGNPRLCGGTIDFHMPSCQVFSRRQGIVNKLVKTLIPIFGFMSLIMLAYIIFHSKKKRSRKPYLLLFSFGKQFPKVSYKDLAQATGDFCESNLIGRGSYGSVYKGKIAPAKTQVAIKVFDLEMRCADKSFISECEVLRNIRHRNLLPILTACSTIDNSGDDFKALVYMFMQNGNLDTWLHQGPSSVAPKRLGLIERMNVAVSIADALAYLHHECGRPIVHCDLKPTNILLDDDMNAHLGDFGIASLVLDSRPTESGHSGPNSSVAVMGTIGYIAPEYAQSIHASTSGDVYSFGVVLLEMLIGKRPTDSMFGDELSIVSFVESNFPDQMFGTIDGHLQEECKGSIKAMPEAEKEIYRCLLALVHVALSCTRLLPRERMNMREVAINLHAIRRSYVAVVIRQQ